MKCFRAEMLLLLISGAISGQNNAAILRFEVASVRPSKPGQGPHGTPLVINHGRVTLDDASLRQIIGHAFSVQRVRVLNCPSWSDSKGFDVIAKAEDPDANEDQIRRMLQTLLLERFKLAAHREKREMQAYVLAVGKNRPKVRDAVADEKGSLDDKPRQLVLKNTPMSRLAALLAKILDTPVEDMTGLKGFYNFILPAGDGVAPGVNDPREILPAAVKNIGFELEFRKMPVEVVVVDHAEEPSPN
jgi:uncharacterized protein (TIGR03435 family)